MNPGRGSHMKRLCTNAHSLNIYESGRRCATIYTGFDLACWCYLARMKDILASLIESVAYKQNKELRLFEVLERQTIHVQEQKLELIFRSFSSK